MDEPVLDPLAWVTDRRWGVEVEINAFDGRNRPEKKDDLPKGIEAVGEEVSRVLKSPVEVTGWQHTHDNVNWVVKPDSSCGIEVCTPVLKGWKGLEQVLSVVQSFREHPEIGADGRCSLHVHVNVHDCSPAEVAGIVAWWVKCEPVFLDSVPPHRKRSRYCQVVGMSDMFDHRDSLRYQTVTERMGQSKYFTINNFHYSKEMRSSIEFRIAEHDACTDPFFIKNWVRLVVHFCEMVKRRGMPAGYAEGAPLTGLCWLDPIDVFSLLGFLPGQYDLSPGLCQTRDWFIARMLLHMRNTGLQGVFSDEGRSYAWTELQEIIRRCGLGSPSGADLHPGDLVHLLCPPDTTYSLFHPSLRT